MNRTCPINFAFEIERYSRCYPGREEQFQDSDGAPLYKLLPNMQAAAPTPMSQTMGSLMQPCLWSAIAAGDGVALEFSVGVLSAETCLLTVTARRGEGAPIILERLYFPQSFSAGFKLSAKPKSLGIKYSKDHHHPNQIFLFQVIFKEEFTCRLCHEILYRCGLLTPAWPTKLAEADFVSQQPKGATAGRDAIVHPSIESAHPLSSITRSPSPSSPAALVPRTPRVGAEDEALTERREGADNSREEPFLRLETVVDSQEIITAQRDQAIALSSSETTTDGESDEALSGDVMEILASQERAQRMIIGTALSPEEDHYEGNEPIEIVPSSQDDDSTLSLVEAPPGGPDADFSFLRQTSYDEYILSD